MARNRYVYRVEARYDDPREDRTRHFQTKAAADRWARARTDGYPADPGDFLDEPRAPIPPAREVTVTRSHPVTFEP